MKSFYLGGAAALMVAMILAACAQVTPIKAILDNPRDYAEKQVTVRGEVRDVFSLFVIKYYTVADATGEIAVVTERPLPKQGAQVTVKGTVKEAFSLGDKTLTLIREAAEPAKP